MRARNLSICHIREDCHSLYLLSGAQQGRSEPLIDGCFLISLFRILFRGSAPIVRVRMKKPSISSIQSQLILYFAIAILVPIGGSCPHHGFFDPRVPMWAMEW